MKASKFILFTSIMFSVSCIVDNKEITVSSVKNPYSASSDSHKVSMPDVQIEEPSFNFGDIMQGQVVSHEFVIRNIGDDKLFINSAKGSCGCTVPVWNKDPIPPGGQTIIKVSFNSAGRQGIQKKTVTLVTNAIPNTKVITINGNVILPEKL